MPVDTDALVALGDLAARSSGARRGSPGHRPPTRSAHQPADRHEQVEPRVWTGTAPLRRRLAVLAAGSAIAGLVLGAALPGPWPAPAALPAHGTAPAVAPGPFQTGSPSPFAAAAGTTTTTGAKVAVTSTAPGRR